MSDVVSEQGTVIDERWPEITLSDAAKILAARQGAGEHNDVRWQCTQQLNAAKNATGKSLDEILYPKNLKN